MIERTSLAVWGAILFVSSVLLLGAWLSMRSLAGTLGTPPEAAAAVARSVAPRDTKEYVAAADVCPGSDELGAAVAVQQQTVLCLLNHARQVHGLPPLSTSPLLMRSAALKAEDIVRCAQFSHEACGLDVRQRFRDSGYFAPDVDSRFGENLAWGGSEAGSPRGALLGWLDSPAHRANLLRGEWTEQGIALVHVPNFRGVEDTRIWVSHFGRRG